jgi:hypothetical protein
MKRRDIRNTVEAKAATAKRVQSAFISLNAWCATTKWSRTSMIVCALDPDHKNK